MENKHSKGFIINIICILAILSIFTISALLLTNVGVQVYKNIVISNTENFKLRTSLSFVATKIRQSDDYEKILLEERKGIPMLVLKEEVDGITYDTMIYFYDGILRELYQETGSKYELSYGEEITEIADFTIKMENQSLIKLTAINAEQEEESLYICMRTAK